MECCHLPLTRKFSNFLRNSEYLTLPTYLIINDYQLNSRQNEADCLDDLSSICAWNSWFRLILQILWKQNFSQFPVNLFRNFNCTNAYCRKRSWLKIDGAWNRSRHCILSLCSAVLDRLSHLVSSNAPRYVLTISHLVIYVWTLFLCQSLSLGMVAFSNYSGLCCSIQIFNSQRWLLKNNHVHKWHLTICKGLRPPYTTVNGLPKYLSIR